MLLQPGSAPPVDTRTLKVVLPSATCHRLHSLKVLTGRPISALVEEAVERHFEQLRASRRAQRSR